MNLANPSLAAIIEKYGDRKDFPNDALIHIVAAIGTVEEMELLVASGANVNAIGDMGYTPLHEAVFARRLDMAEKLAALGADPTIINDLDETPPALARSIECLEIANLFTKIDTPLDALIAKYRYINAFAELDLSDINRQCYPGDDALIHIVAAIGTVEEMELLVASGANVNAIGDMGNTPLHYAAMEGRLDMAEKLAALGADLTIRNEFGGTPRDTAEIAQKLGHVNVFKLLPRVDHSSNKAK